MEKATFLQRLVAFTIDFVILTAIFAGIGFAGGLVADAILASNVDVPQELRTAPYLLAQFLNLGLMLAYCVIPWSTSGQTPGKRVMRLKVVRADGTQLPWESAIQRWVGYLVGSFFFWLGFLWALVDKNQECWQDKMAGSVVVKA